MGSGGALLFERLLVGACGAGDAFVDVEGGVDEECLDVEFVRDFEGAVLIEDLLLVGSCGAGEAFVDVERVDEEFLVVEFVGDFEGAL